MAPFPTFVQVNQMIEDLRADLGTLIRQLQGSGPSLQPGDLKMSAAASGGAGWLLCNGATYNVSDYPALAAALGAGGTTFAVPDLQGRVPVGAGSGAGLTARSLGGVGGSEPSNMLNHTHPIGYRIENLALGGSPMAIPDAGNPNTYPTLGPTPASTGADNMPPFRVVNIFIRT